MRSVTLAMLTTVALCLPAAAQQNGGSPPPQGHTNAQNQNRRPGYVGYHAVGKSGSTVAADLEQQRVPGRHA